MFEIAIVIAIVLVGLAVLVGALKRDEPKEPELDLTDKLDQYRVTKVTQR